MPNDAVAAPTGVPKDNGCSDLAPVEGQSPATGNNGLATASPNFWGPLGRYPVILADPPWSFKTRSAKGTQKSPSRHYDVMDLAAIKALPVADLAAPDCHLFLWTTAPHLLESFDTLKAWGFKYSTVGFVWVKTTPKSSDHFFTVKSLHTGMGYGTRQNAEIVLHGRRGQPKVLAHDVHSVIIAKRREHSRKPDEARARIERMCAGPYVELFARTAAPGWDCWGNELDKFEP